MTRPLLLGALLLAAVAALAAFASARGPIDDADAFRAYVEGEDWPLAAHADEGDYVLDARLLTPEAAAAPDAARFAQDGWTDAERLQWDAIVAEYSEALLVRVSIRPADPDRDLVFSRLGDDAFSDWNRELLFRLDQHAALVTDDGLRAPAATAYMVRSYGVHYGMGGGRTFVLSFPPSVGGHALLDARRLSLRLDEFGLQTGPLDFPFQPHGRVRGFRPR